MCGRYVNARGIEEMTAAFEAERGDVGEWEPTYSTAPTDRALVVREVVDEGRVRRGLTGAIWDTVQPPRSSARGPVINARREKLAGYWIGAFSSTRCIVPMDGYYEWTGPKTDRQGHYIHAKEPLAAAGLMVFKKIEGRVDPRFAIITWEGRDASGQLHDRMPMFLTPTLWDRWLDPEPLTVADPAESQLRREELIRMLDASAAEISRMLTSHPVGRAINNVRTVDWRDPSVIEPMESPA